MADTSQFNFSDKSYILTQMMIYPSSGSSNSVDVMGLMMELTIFEDMFATCVSGELLINDSLDLVALLPITGFDFLKLIYSKPGQDDIEISRVFRIYKIDRRMVNEGNQSGQVYSLRFCSEENIVSNSIDISKSYKGKNVSDIVTDIVKNILKVPGNRVGQFEKPEGVFDIIIPSMMPFEAIGMVVNRSIPTHVFFENRDGYQLKSLNTLVSGDPIAKYRYVPANVDVGSDGIFKVIDYEFVKSNDNLQAINRGMFSGRLTTFDIVRWKTAAINFSYKEDFGKNDHVGPGMFDNGYQDRLKKTPSENTNSFQRLYPTNMQHNSDKNISDNQPGIKQTLVEKWLLQRQSSIEQLHYFKMNVVVPGTTAVTVGDTVEFAFPLLSSKTDTEDNLNPYYKGKYLVTAIRHKINYDHYEMVMELTKDAFDTVLPSADNSDPGLNSMRNS